MGTMLRGLALALVCGLVGCGGRPAQRAATDPSAPLRAPRVPRAPRAASANLPSIGGFHLGGRWIDEVRRCVNAANWRVDADGMSGTCSTVLTSISYPVESVFLRRCGTVVCQITVRVPMEGETQLEQALADISTAWRARYSAAGASTDTDSRCRAELGATRLSCLLRGEGMPVFDYMIPPAFEVADGSRAQIYAVGAAGPQRATIRLTLATPDGIAAANRRDL